MKKLTCIVLACTLFFGACNKSTVVNEVTSASIDEQQAVQLFSPQQINAFIKKVVKEKGTFEWSDATDLMLYSAIMQSKDHMISVGFKPADENNIEQRLTSINISNGKWAAVKAQLIQMIFLKEKSKQPALKLEDVEVWKENKLPFIDVRIDNLSTVKLLRSSNLIRYVEPMSYEPSNFDEALQKQVILDLGSGCGGYIASANLQEGDDYTTIPPGAKQSWNYTYHNIPAAWALSTGAGIKILVIDTGVSPSQVI